MITSKRRPGAAPRLWCRLMLAASAVLAGACSSTSDKAAKPTPLAPISGAIAIHRSWEVDLGDCEGTFLRPAVLENAIYAASRKGTVLRIDPVTGKEVWRVQLEGGIMAGVGSDGAIVAVAGPRGNVVAYNAEGKRLWEAQASSDVLVPPLVGHDLVVVRSTDQRLAAYDAATGARRWVFQKQQPALTLRIETELAFFGDSVLVGFPGGRLDAVALSNGAGRWEAGVSEPKGATEVERLADVLGSPALGESDVCSASFQGRMACFDARSGDLRWAREFSAGAGAAIGADAVYGVDATSHLHAFERAGGNSLWQNGVLANRSLSAPVLVGKLLAVGDYEGVVHFFSADEGKLVGRYEVSGGPVISGPQAWNGAALFQTAKGRLVLLAPGATP